MLSAFLASAPAWAAPVIAPPPRPVFDVVPLGVEGGVVEGATTAWFVAPRGGGAGVVCDAGTLVPGIRAAIAKGAFGSGATPSDVLHRRIAGYLVTHPHLDHVAGLVMASPDDVAKPIYGFSAVNDALAADYFNWSAWPNMGDRGKPPLLRRYRYHDLPDAPSAVPIEGTALSVTAYPLSHGGALSTAFLIRSGDKAVLCMGDTGPDEVERSTRLAVLWHAVAPLIREGRLRAIIVETSYPDPRPESELFGHLTPRWLHEELNRLAALVADAQRMRGVPIVIGHVKPGVDSAFAARLIIERQLRSGPLGTLDYRLPRQGEALRF